MMRLFYIYLVLTYYQSQIIIMLLFLFSILTMIYLETLCHLFWDCNIVKHFVMEVHLWLMSSIPNLNFELSKKNFLFGCPQLNIPCNNIILLLKYYIYRCKMMGVFLNLNAFQKHVKSLIVTEKFVAIQLVKLDTFTKVWQDFIPLS